MDFASTFLKHWESQFGNNENPPILTCLEGSNFASEANQSLALDEEIDKITLKSIKLHQELKKLEFVTDFLESCRSQLGGDVRNSLRSRPASQRHGFVQMDSHDGQDITLTQHNADYDDVYFGEDQSDKCSTTESLDDYLEDDEFDETLSHDRTVGVELRRKSESTAKRMTLTERLSTIQREDDPLIVSDTKPKSHTYPRAISSDRQIKVISDLYDTIARTISEDDQSLAPSPSSRQSTGTDTPQLSAEDIVKLTERRAALTRILEVERSHIEILRVLEQYHKALRSSSDLDQGTEEIYSKIFFKIPQLLNAQQKFVRAMEVRLSDRFEPTTTIHDLLQFIVSESVFFEYMDNIHVALASCQTAGKIDKNFQLYLSKKIAIAQETDGKKINAATHYSIQDLIALPMKWLITHAENIKRLLSLTPSSHPDHKKLHTALSDLLKSISQAAGGIKMEEFISMQSTQVSDMRKPSLIDQRDGRQLVMERFLVEVVSGRRKLRRVFLFTDLLVCAKPQLGAGSMFVDASVDELDSLGEEMGRKCELEVKWFIPLHSLALHKTQMRDDDEEKESRKNKDMVKQLKSRIKDLRSEVRKLRSESRTSFSSQSGLGAVGGDMEESHSEFSFLRRNNPLKRLEKKEEELGKLQGDLLLASQNRPLIISWVSHHGTKVEKRFLLGSELEWNEWREAIQRLHMRCVSGVSSSTQVTPELVRLLVTRYSRNMSINNLGYAVLKTSSSRPNVGRPLAQEESGLAGMLQVVIHRLEGPSDLDRCFVSVELDSLGQFMLFAKTTPGNQGKIDESFEMHLDGSETTIRFLVNRAAPISSEAKNSTSSELDSVLGKLDLRLTENSLNEYKEKSHSVFMATDPDEKCLLVLSLIFQSQGLTLKRHKSRVNHSLFGVSLQQINKRFRRRTDDSHVPELVQCCVGEIESRGLNEAGIYRISAASNEVVAMCKRLESSANSMETSRSSSKSLSPWKRLLSGTEVHVISNILKKFFRELTDPIFTAHRYSAIRDAFEIKVEESRVVRFQEIVQGLPEPNLSTARFICSHLITVSENQEVNKMTLNNLALIFGPTLLAPPPSPSSSGTIGVLAAALKETSILLYVLKLHLNNKLFSDN